MEELIKVAGNGQWILEKAKRQLSPEEQKKIMDFIARQRQPTQVAPKPNPAAGMVSYQGNQGQNPKYTKEQVAAIRAGIPEATATKLIPQKTSAMDAEKEKHIARTQQRMEAQQAADDERARARQGNKAAWKQEVQFLGAKGGEEGGSTEKDILGVKGYGAGKATGKENKGWQSMAAAQEQQDALNEAHRTGKAPVKPKRELQPPMEMIRDPQGNASMQVRQGKMHNEGARTRGKIVSKGMSFPTGEKDEAGKPVMGFRSVPMQEEHVWSWDHPKKQWNHVKTNLVPVGKTG